MAKMPQAMEIVRGDECFKYLLLSNTHAGDGSVIVKFTAMRVVCLMELKFSELASGQNFFVGREYSTSKTALPALMKGTSLLHSL